MKAVLFDLDGTLFDRDATVQRVLAWQAAAFRAELPPGRGPEFIARVTALDAHGHHDKRELYDRVARQFGLDDDCRERLIDTFWRRYHALAVATPDALRVLDALRASGFRTGIVTTGMTTVQDGTIDALDLRPRVDAVLVSEREGLRKPDPALFHRAAARLTCRAEECWYVGDHPTVDVDGARAAGLRAVWKRTPYWSTPAGAPVVDRLSELLPLVGRPGA
jgi:putative hydrolase of the HAD superfamily